MMRHPGRRQRHPATSERLQFTRGQDLLDLVADLKTTLKPGEVEQRRVSEPKTPRTLGRPSASASTRPQSPYHFAVDRLAADGVTVAERFAWAGGDAAADQSAAPTPRPRRRAARS